MAVLGYVGCVVAIIVGFIPLNNIDMSVTKFDMLLIIGGNSKINYLSNY